MGTDLYRRAMNRKNNEYKEEVADMIIKTISRYMPEIILSKLRPIWRGILSTRRAYKPKLLAIGDSIGIIGPNQIYDEEYFKKRKKNPRRSDAHSIAKSLEKEFEPNSVIDFGCAIGIHLEYFYKNNVSVTGVEGNTRAIQNSVIPKDKIQLHDLRKRYKTNKEYDLVLSFEVAEHIPQKYADTFVKTLTPAGDTIVITAAPPGQGGTHHVNEQPREYWYEKFKAEGMVYDKKTTESLRKDIEVEKTIEIPENIMVYQRETQTNMKN